MTYLKTGLTVLLLSVLSACGTQIVEFENPVPVVDAGTNPALDAGTDAGTDAGIDAGVNLAPTVTSNLPVNDATGVALNTSLSALFSEAMDSATLNTSTFTLKQGVNSISGAVTYVSATRTVSFAPSAPLEGNLVYIAALTTGAKDTSGLALAANHTWSFTTLAVAAPPTVTSNTPLANATNVAINNTPTATFSKAMDSTTVNDLTFTVKQGLAPVSGVVTFNALTDTATFTPAAALENNKVYTATVTTGAKDTGALAMAADHSWTFTTTAAVPPTVTATTPLDLATNVQINKRPTATFSKAMDPTKLTSLTFNLKQGLVPVLGAVTYDVLTKTATFSPDVALVVGMTYTATVTTGAEDLSGLGLAVDHVWTFTTAACAQALVDLGSAGNFVVLAGSTVTNTGLTSVTGDLGVSPGSAVTGFGPGTIVGGTYAGDAVSAQATFDLTVAYNDAAGRTLCPVSVAGNLGGQTLAPGLYKSTGSLEVSSGDLTLDAQGDGDAVFIFQIASTLDTTSDRKVFLINGAKSANVFWQVGTSATLGTTTAFHGTIMADQAVTLRTGATLNGRALARIAKVELDSNIIVKPTP